MKKFLLFLLIILFIISIYKDLSIDRNGFSHNNKQPTSEYSTMEKDYSFTTVKIKVLPGESFLSIMDEINDEPSININQMLEDFKVLNPTIDPYKLKAGSFYYFPNYSP